MIQYLKRDKWSPYLVGALIGCLLTGLVVSKHTIGASTAIARVAALIENGVSSTHVKQTPYFSKLLEDGLIFNWSILFLLGLFLGAWTSSKLVQNKSDYKEGTLVSAFGVSKIVRKITAFIGGFLLLFGARMANGCTSGHAISGGAQLSITSFVFMLTLFAVGIPVSHLLYKRRSL